MIHSLSDWNPLSVRYYKGSYCWDEMKELYIAKQKERAQSRNIDYQFLIDLASAALGGKKSEEGIGLDTGEGAEDMTPEQEAMWREVLGDSEYERMYLKECS